MRNTLYKKDSKGKLRLLDISTDGATIVQVSGLIDGKATTNVSQCEGKNIGRSNETSPEQQADLEAEAKYTKKLKEGYFKTKQEAIDEVVILPMLAKVFGKEEKKVTYPCYAQPKLDGMRGLGDVDKSSITSRQGNDVGTLSHITKVFPRLIAGDIILDGELYAHGQTFQENMRLIKKYRAGKTECVKYHVYDCVSDLPFRDRFDLVTEICGGHPEFVVVETVVINNKEELMAYHAKNISLGFEGTIVRWGEDGYKLNGRSSNLLKLKDFSDLALPLLGVTPSEKRPDFGLPYFYWKGARKHPMGDDILGAGVAMSHNESRNLLTNADSLIGKTCELRFFEYSEDGVPRHPTMDGFRLDK